MPVGMLDLVAAAFDTVGIFSLLAKNDGLSELDRRKVLECVLFVCTADRHFAKEEAAHLTSQPWMPKEDPERLERMIADLSTELMALDGDGREAYAKTLAGELSDDDSIRRETLVAASVAAEVDRRGYDKQREAYMQLAHFIGMDAASVDDEAKQRLNAKA